MTIQQKIGAYHGDLIDDPHHRYRSWEHCYKFFQDNGSTGVSARRDDAAIQLAFYLASWGMYRGSSFLLQRAYTAHLNVIDCLCSSSFAPLWDKDIGSSVEHKSLALLILSVVEEVRDAYKPFGQPTDTLITKVLLGTLGCLPACDRFFISGFQFAGFSYSALNTRFVDRVLQFCVDNANDLRSEQLRIETRCGIKYPFMKLVDMYFWQTGYEASS